MNIVPIFITLIIIGVVIYLVNSVIPMVAWMKTVINCVAAILVCLWLLKEFGIYDVPMRIR